MAFPRINALSFWLLPLGGAADGLGLPGHGRRRGVRLDRVPAAVGRASSTGTGTDLWIMGLTLIGTSSILGAINFLVTIFKMRAPGMTLFRMPILVWTVLVTSVLVLMATPVLTSALIMLFIDRNYGGHFFDPANGGNADPVPERVLVLLAPGGLHHDPAGDGDHLARSCRSSRASRCSATRRSCSRPSRIGALGFSVWAHHMFTTGAVFLPFFSPDDVPDRGPDRRQDVQLDRHDVARPADASRRRCCSRSGFLTMFLIGGINGAFSAAVPVDFAIHDTYWVVAHIHYVLFGGSVFAIFAGIYYWFPKMTGRMLNETPGQDPVRAHVHRVQPDLLPDAPAGPGGHAAPDRGLRRERRLERAQPDRHHRRLHHRRQHAAVLLERADLAAQRQESPATTRGRATPSSGRPRRRRPPTTSTTCPRSAPSDRSSTPGTAGRRPTDGRSADMTADATTLTAPSEHAAEAHAAETHAAGGIGNPVLGMLLFITSEVMFFAGLFAAYFTHPGRLHRARRRGRHRGLAADAVRRPAQPVPPDHRVRRPQPDPAGHDHPRRCRR